MTSNGGWSTEYACVNHAVLSPDAWHQVHCAKPVGDGAKAALVCRFVCKVRTTCPFSGSGHEAVTGEGWFDQLGQFIRPDDTEIELEQAALYIGLKVEALRYLLKRRGIEPTRKFRYLTFFPLKDIERIASQRRPEHGTMARLEIHQLLGETDCRYCNDVLAGV